MAAGDKNVTPTVEENGASAEDVTDAAILDLATKTVTRLLTWDAMKAKKKVPDRNGVFTGDPREFNIDTSDPELGINKGDQIAVHFRPMTPKDDAEIREVTQDFPVDNGVWQAEYNDELLMRCLIEPRIPMTAEGRKYLQEWLPGTRASIALAISNQSGMGRHLVRNAEEELKNLQALTKPTSKS